MTTTTLPKPGPCYTRENRDLTRRRLKTNTRRIIPAKNSWGYYPADRWWVGPDPNGGWMAYDSPSGPDAKTLAVLKRAGGKGFECRYAPGDILYMIEPLISSVGGHAISRDDSSAVMVGGKLLPWRWQRNTLPQIHMPREAARTFHKVKAVRVERLQDISEADAKAEGVSLTDEFRGHKVWHASYRAAFAALWMQIHGVEAWARNDYVFAITYRLINPGASK